MKNLFTLLLLLFSISIVKSQTQLPVVMMMSTEEITGTDEVLCHLKVRNFREIAGFQFTLKWNPGEMEYIHVENSGLPGFNPLCFNDKHAQTSGYWLTSWTSSEPGIRCIDFKNETTILTFRFKKISGLGHFSIVSNPLMVEIFNCDITQLDLIFINNFVDGTSIREGSEIYMENLSTEQITIYPNPARDQIYFNWNNATEIPDRASIYNLQGQIVSPQNIDNQSIVINEAIIPGTYMLLLFNGQKFLGTKKVMIKD